MSNLSVELHRLNSVCACLEEEIEVNMEQLPPSKSVLKEAEKARMSIVEAQEEHLAVAQVEVS